MDTIYKKGLVWLRRDLRAHDHTALHHALTRCQQVWVAFVFDPNILASLPRHDARVQFLVNSLEDLDQQLRQLGQHASGHPHTGLLVMHGDPVHEIAQLAQTLGVEAVFAAQDHEPYASERDARVLGELAHRGIVMHSYQDQTLAGVNDVRSQTDRPYTTYSPYKKGWFAQLSAERIQSREVEPFAGALASIPDGLKNFARVPSVNDLGFEAVALPHPSLHQGRTGALVMLEDFRMRMERYKEARDFPSIKGPSYLSVHLRFGTLSARELARAAWEAHQHGQPGATAWLSELAWRDFFMQVMHHHPRVVTEEFRPLADPKPLAHGHQAQARFEAWKAGQTGVPFVDAGMRQLSQTGYMHNRLRMVTAMYLCKQLAVNWRWGEAWFAEKLLDFDLALNNGNWQWVTGTGSEANPPFRVFNPVLQSQRFDPEGKFIRRYVPEVAELSNKCIHAPWLASPMERMSAGIELGKTYPQPLV